jgi:hypothetical protein
MAQPLPTQVHEPIKQRLCRPELGGVKALYDKSGLLVDVELVK